MDQKLLKKIPDDVIEIGKSLKEKGFQAYLVGGSIRDLLLGIDPYDFDIASDATPSSIQEIFPHTVDVGAKFGTIKVIFSKDDPNRVYEVTTFRNEGNYEDSRRPSEVEFSKSLEEDLKRRDFTINAFAMDLTNITGEIIDLFGGRDDLNNKLIKAVGNPLERFTEDALRMIKACRMVAQLDFGIDEETLKAIQKLSKNIQLISQERIREEFVKIVNANNSIKGLEMLRETGLMTYVIPELLEGFGVYQNEYHSDDVYYHSLKCMETADEKVKLAALFHDIGKPRVKEDGHFYAHENVGTMMTEDIMKRLKFSTKEINHTSQLVKMHMFNYTKDWSDAAVRRFMARVGDSEILEDLYLLRHADVVSNKKSDFDSSLLDELQGRIEKIKTEANATTVKELKINGDDLIKLGVQPGPEIGRILNVLLERVIEDPSLNTKDKLVNIFQEIHK